MNYAHIIAVNPAKNQTDLTIRQQLMLEIESHFSQKDDSPRPFTPILFEQDLDYRNKYLSGALSSQAKNLQKSPIKMRNKACLLRVIANHLKDKNRTCFINSQTMVAEFARFAPQFNVKTLKISAINKLLTELYADKLIKNLSDGMRKSRRQLVVMFDALAAFLPSVYNQLTANHREKVAIKNDYRLAESQQFAEEMNDKYDYSYLKSPVDNLSTNQNNSQIQGEFSEKLQDGGVLDELYEKTLKNIELKNICNMKITNRRSNRSLRSFKEKTEKRDLNKRRSFDFSIFKADHALAERLHKAAKVQQINNKGLMEILRLHWKHGVNISQKFHLYLRRLAHQNAKKSEVERQDRDQFFNAFPVFHDQHIKACLTIGGAK